MEFLIHVYIFISSGWPELRSHNGLKTPCTFLTLSCYKILSQHEISDKMMYNITICWKVENWVTRAQISQWFEKSLVSFFSTFLTLRSYKIPNQHEMSDKMMYNMIIFGKVEIWVTRAWISKWPPFLIHYGGQLTMNQMVPPTFSTLPVQVL